MPHRILNGRRALVTGASSGIGRALAIELARKGVDLVLVARREDKLAGTCDEVRALGRTAIAVAGDITQTAVRSRAVEAASDKLGGLDILVNNAGVGAHGRFADADPSRLRPIMEVNFFAPVELIRASLPLLREGRDPVIVNIGSILGERGAPHKSEYSASKFALHGFSESIRPELAKLGIDVLVVAAGPTATEHFDTLLEELGEMPWGNPRRKPAADVACSIVRAIEHRRQAVVTHWGGWLWVVANRLAPRLVDRLMLRYG
jgi:short-subunit dehydrogenase